MAHQSIARVLLYLLLASIAGVQTVKAAEPVRVIFDTDMWSDIDDAMALAMLHALHDRHEINLLAVTVSTDERWCAPYVDLLDTFYGHAQIPIGVVRDGPRLETLRKLYPDWVWPGTRYTEVVTQRKKKDGSWVYPHRLADGSTLPEAVSLLQKTLSAQPDGSVVMIQVGYSTNLARLLDSAPDLIRKKVRLLSVMAGNFENGESEFNVYADVKSAQKLFADWPTPIVASGFEIGKALTYPHESIEHDYGYVPDHPIADTYRTFCEEQRVKGWWKTCPHDHATYDLTAVLYAARPDRDYFALSKSGKITVLPDGRTRFEESSTGTHRHLILDQSQKGRAIEAMVMLTSQPPRSLR